MKTLYGLILMSRPINLLMVVLTMAGIRWWLVEPVLQTCGVSAVDVDFAFFSMMLVLVILTASGNIINDYFDVRVDRINKPKRVVIDRLVKRRVAIVAHFVLNALAVFLSLAVVWKTRIYLLALIPVLLTFALWFYSMTLKKHFLTGNLLVALMVSTVPFIAGLTLIRPSFMSDPGLIICFPWDDFGLSGHEWAWAGVLAYTAFAFHLTLLREILKDQEDLEGDMEAGFRTVPVVLGTKRTNVITGFLAVFALAISVVFEWKFLPKIADQPVLPALVLTIAVQLPLLLSLWFSWRKGDKRDYSKAQNLVKLAMVGGICVLLFL